MTHSQSVLHDRQRLSVLRSAGVDSSSALHSQKSFCSLFSVRVILNTLLIPTYQGAHESFVLRSFCSPAPPTHPVGLSSSRVSPSGVESNKHNKSAYLPNTLIVSTPSLHFPPATRTHRDRGGARESPIPGSSRRNDKFEG